VRHVRTLGLCLVAAFAISAIAAVPALARSQFTVKTWTQYAHCPYEEVLTIVHEASEAICFYGETSGGKNGGFFKVGNVKVPLSKPVKIQGAAYEDGEVAEIGQPALKIVAATNAGETLESPELKVEKGLNLITKQIQKEAGWPQALVESFNEAKANKETGLNVKIEVAGGNRIYEEEDGLSTGALIEQRTPAFTLPLKTRLISSWLEKLGGGPCTVGNEEHPIIQYLTSEAPGSVENLNFNEEFNNISLESTLVALNWPVEEGAGATGCGGEYESYVDAAINDTLGLKYHELGTTVLTGTLFAANPGAVKEEAEAGHV
jgi:hypothetical protein